MSTSFLWCYIRILLRKFHLWIKPMTCHCRPRQTCGGMNEVKCRRFELHGTISRIVAFLGCVTWKSYHNASVCLSVAAWGCYNMKQQEKVDLFCSGWPPPSITTGSQFAEALAEHIRVHIYGNSSPRFSVYFFFFSFCTQDQQYALMWSWKRFDKG